MNDLIERLIKNKFKIGVFPIHESDWLDSELGIDHDGY